MNGIFGIVRRDGGPVDPSVLERMRSGMADWARDGHGTWVHGQAGLGQARTFATPEGIRERLPIAAAGLAFTAAGRVDNREDLLAACGVTGTAEPGMADGDVILLAYRKWGEACVEHVLGDWAFAAWHPAERRLVLARDHFGNTSLYYHLDERHLAFASDQRALLAAGLDPGPVDELYLAQVLVSWFAYHGERTVASRIRRLPPAHTLRLTRDGMATRQYWFLERTPPLHLPRREDYADGLRAAFDEAVRARLRAPPAGRGVASGRPAIAAQLSGGLDSGAVVATAAGFLKRDGHRLDAFTAVPRFDVTRFQGRGLGDERRLARATAEHAGGVDLVEVRAERTTPVGGVRRALEIHGEPVHAAGSYHWILELQREARERGNVVLLTGQMGNGAFSWPGDPRSQPPGSRGSRVGRPTSLRTALRPWVPEVALRALRRLRGPPVEWWRASALHPDFAERLRIRALREADPDEAPPRDAAEARRWLMPGRSIVGALHAQAGAAHGLEVRDPTGDVRVLTFAWSVPDAVFIDPGTGLNRWLARAAMTGRLPDPVRLSTRVGIQGADLVPRLRTSRDEVEAALDELSRGPATGYVDVPRMWEDWRFVQRHDSVAAAQKAGSVLMRGIMAGLHVNASQKGGGG